MNEDHSQSTQVERLLEQDMFVSSFDYGEFRMNLKKAISRLEDRARAIHRAALVSLTSFIVCVVLAPLVTSGGQPWLLRTWSACGFVALFVTAVLAGIDHYKYRPALERKRRDFVLTAIDELRLEVAELKEKLS